MANPTIKDPAQIAGNQNNELVSGNLSVFEIDEFKSSVRIHILDVKEQIRENEIKNLDKAPYSTEERVLLRA